MHTSLPPPPRLQTKGEQFLGLFSFDRRSPLPKLRAVPVLLALPKRNNAAAPFLASLSAPRVARVGITPLGCKDVRVPELSRGSAAQGPRKPKRTAAGGGRNSGAPELTTSLQAAKSPAATGMAGEKAPRPGSDSSCGQPLGRPKGKRHPCERQFRARQKREGFFVPFPNDGEQPGARREKAAAESRAARSCFQSIPLLEVGAPAKAGEAESGRSCCWNLSILPYRK